MSELIERTMHLHRASLFDIARSGQDPAHRQQLRDMLGPDIGKRDRLPYTKRFDEIVDTFNRTQPRPVSPHLVWRLVATLAK